MARAERDFKPVPGLAPGLAQPLPTTRRRLSSGHLVMIVSGLLATVLTYSILRSAGGTGTQVLVAAQAIPAGSAVDPSMVATTQVKASSSVLAGLELPDQQSALTGQIAAVDIPAGAVLEAQQFRPATAQPPRMTIQVDPQAIPGGAGSLRAGSRIDVIAATSAGATLAVTGLLVVKPPPAGARADQALSAASATVPIEVAVPDLATANQLYQATSTKFQLRVSDPGAPAPGPAGTGG